MKRLSAVAPMVALAVLAAGCSEKPQSVTARKSDMAAWQGSANPARADTGWTSGDRESWVLHLQNRAQSQNEYTRTSVPPRNAAP
jgi:hypothetical protein